MSDISHFDTASFDDRRGRYPDRIGVSVSKELGRIARGIANERGISIAEFARRALIGAIVKSDAVLSDAATGNPLGSRGTHFEGPADV